MSSSFSSTSAGASGSAAAGALPLDPPPLISHSTAPMAIVSPSCAWILAITPAVGEGTSASTLSVETSTNGSSRATVSPSFLSHSRMVPSVTESPIAGMTTETVVSTATAQSSVPALRFSM